MAVVKDRFLASKPRIPYSTFRAVLKSAKSPAYPSAKACWNAIIKYGIDPAVALAQFDKESTYGLHGVATKNKSWGNLRHNGVFIAYKTWAAGTDDYARLLSGSLYAKSKNYNTVRKMPFRYAPAADHNSPVAYGQFMMTMIDHYYKLNPK